MKFSDGKGFRKDVPYNAELMGVITVDGVVIHNPLRTPDNSAFCTPERYGFDVWETGGGCQAWGLELPDGTCITITDESGCGLPKEDDEYSPMIGRSNAGGDDIASVEDFAELPLNGSV